MTNQYIGVDNTVTNSDRTINCYPAVLGGQVRKDSAQDFVFGRLLNSKLQSSSF